MKTFKNQAAQGDLVLDRVDEIPADAVLKTPNNNEHTLAHSETGHNHVVQSEHVDFYQSANDPFVGFIDVKKETELKHLRSYDTHESLLIPVGRFKVIRQRQQTLEGITRVVD